MQTGTAIAAVVVAFGSFVFTVWSHRREQRDRDKAIIQERERAQELRDQTVVVVELLSTMTAASPDEVVPTSCLWWRLSLARGTSESWAEVLRFVLFVQSFDRRFDVQPEPGETGETDETGETEWVINLLPSGVDSVFVAPGRPAVLPFGPHGQLVATDPIKVGYRWRSGDKTFAWRTPMHVQPAPW